MTEKNIKLIRSKQVCEKLSVGTTTLFNKLMKSDDFPKATKIGGTNAWRECDIDDWINQQMEKQQEVSS